MRARSVRLHTCSADDTFHRNRAAFQDALFEVLSPILGSLAVRQKAATGVYGGKLPSWWRDLETEKAVAEKAAATEKATAAVEDRKPLVTHRHCCRYGADCFQKG